MKKEIRTGEKPFLGFNSSNLLQIGDVGSDRVDQELHKEKEMVTDSTKQMKELGAIIERQLETNQGGIREE